MAGTEIITRNPKILAGKPIIAGTRISVELIIRKIAAGFSIEDILEAYPHLSEQQVKAALDFAADMISREIMVEA